MNVFKAVIEVIRSLGRGTSQREIKRAEAAAPVEGPAVGGAVAGQDHDHDRLDRTPALARTRTATSRRSAPPPRGVGRQ